MTTENFNILKSFKLEAIKDTEMRKFSCWGSVEVIDRHNEVIPADEIYKIMDIWMDRGAPIMFNHTNRNVGKGLNWQPLEKDGKPGVLITGMIHKHYSEDDDVWKGIKEGKFEGLSIGGKSFTRDKQEDGTTFLRDLIGYEFSVVERTGNQEATFTEVNQMAKSKEIKKEEEQVMEETPETEQTSEDIVAEIASQLAELTEKVNKIESAMSGAPEEEEPVEEQKEEEESEEPEEEEKTEEEEDDSVSKSEFEELKKAFEDLKKSSVKKVIPSTRPATAPKNNDAHSEIRKSLQEMRASGKIDFKTIGAKLREVQN